jgi:membrane fusion protein (multidrug efflux system)
MKWILGLVIAAAVVAGALWAYDALGTPKVAVAVPERREAIKVIYATGMVKAEQIARLRPEAGGEVTLVGVRVGEEVRQGMTVMAMTVREEQEAAREQSAILATATKAADDALAILQKEQELLAAGTSSQQMVDEAKARYDKAVSNLNAVKSTVAARPRPTGRGTLTSPITGIVTKVAVNVGDVVSPNIEAITIIDPSSFKIYADIDELDINRIRPGQEAVVALDALPNSRFRARVERIIPQADEVTKTLPVVLNLLDYVTNLSDGLTATVNIIQDRRPHAVTIPSSALLDESSTAATVFVVSDRNILERRRIRIGVRGEDYVEVLEGVHEDERVALEPKKDWKSGMEIEIDKSRMKKMMKAKTA